jgi:hypothetical protein
VLPSLPLETPLKQEKSLSTSGESQQVQWIPSAPEELKTSFSNSESHFKHLYSKIGIITSKENYFTPSIQGT